MCSSDLGDEHGATLKDGVVTTAPGWKEAYARWMESGWSGVVSPTQYGGMGLPHLLNSACLEVWTSANMAFMLAPMLGFGAVEAIDLPATDIGLSYLVFRGGDRRVRIDIGELFRRPALARATLDLTGHARRHGAEIAPGAAAVLDALDLRTR